MQAPKARRALQVAPPWRDTPSTTSEDALVKGLLSGDPRLAAELHDRLIHVVERTILRVMGVRENDHDDLVQITFEQIVLSLKRERFLGGCTLTGWASIIAAHIALKAIRSRQRYRKVFDPREVEDIDTKDASIDLDREIDHKRLVARARQHLAAMDSGQAEAVLLHDVLGHPLADIASNANLTFAAAQSRLVRGRQELTKRMERDHRILAAKRSRHER